MARLHVWACVGTAALSVAGKAGAAGLNVSFDGNRGAPPIVVPSLKLAPRPHASGGARGASAAPARGGRCGVERWAVKTLSDPDAGAVNLQPVDSSVAALAKSPAGSPWKVGSGSGYNSPPDRRILSGPYAETQVYRVRATLTAYKSEADQDIHLVLSDPRTGDTLDAESVDPSCPGAGSSAEAGVFADVRRELQSLFPGQPAPGQMNSVNVPVTLTGVRFFDPPHGQVGHADNGAELHPVLCISTGSGCD